MLVEYYTEIVLLLYVQLKAAYVIV